MLKNAIKKLTPLKKLMHTTSMKHEFQYSIKLLLFDD